MNKTIYALGFFDGVHIGHAALLEAVRRLGGETGCGCGAVTFDVHPHTLVQGAAPGLINTPSDRERLLRQTFSMERVVTLPFNEKVRTSHWREFLDMLRKDHGAAGFVCGVDFRFGYKGEGNASCLEAYCAEAGLPFAAVPEQRLDGIRVSSTHIRQLIQNGQMTEALRFLGHPHILTGSVVPGKQLGRRLGIPTANLRLPDGLLVPKFGVYACKVALDGKCYTAVTNVGIRPTVEGTGITVEPWILDYSGDLYGRQITLEFYAFLRPEEKFENLQALKDAILADARAARGLLE